jgi:N-acetylneuraminic acid mutarotase
MRKLIMIIAVVLCSFICANIVFATADTWTQKADFGGVVREGAVGFSIGDKGYIAGGDNINLGQVYKDLWEYDPGTDTWTQKSDISGDDLAGLDLAVAFSIGSKGYVGTGRLSATATQGVKSFWEYDPAANTWTPKADFGGTGRYSAVGFSIGNKGYIGTGLNNSAPLSDVWEYNPAANTWTRKADFAGGGRSDAVGFSISNKGYLGTGVPASRDFWEYDPAANTWTQKTDFGGGGPRNGAVGFSVNGKGYIGAGVYGFMSYSDLWEYDPAANAWTQKTDFGGGVRYRAAGFVIGSKGYIGTGLVGNPLRAAPVSNDFWEYDTGNAEVATFAEFDTETCSTLPVITSLTASPSMLWPPNNKMVAVTLSATVTDACGDPSPVTNIIAVLSNEPAESNAFANGQALITGNLTLELKADRNGNGNGRIYTIIVETTDSYGNSATNTVNVTVPHDQGKGNPVINNLTAFHNPGKGNSSTNNIIAPYHRGK